MKQPIEIKCPQCHEIVVYKRNKFGRWVGTAIGCTGGGISGGIMGSSVGVVLMGTAIFGLLPVAIIGAAFFGDTGHLLGKKIETVACPSCQTSLKFES